MIRKEVKKNLIDLALSNERRDAFLFMAKLLSE